MDDWGGPYGDAAPAGRSHSQGPIHILKREKEMRIEKADIAPDRGARDHGAANHRVAFLDERQLHLIDRHLPAPWAGSGEQARRIKIHAGPPKTRFRVVEDDHRTRGTDRVVALADIQEQSNH